MEIEDNRAELWKKHYELEKKGDSVNLLLSDLESLSNKILDSPLKKSDKNIFVAFLKSVYYQRDKYWNSAKGIIKSIERIGTKIQKSKER